MYQDYYHLRKEPFHVTPDPEFLFLSPSHKQALGSIIYGVKNKKGFIVITGEVGVGKTTIVRSYQEGVVRQKTNIIYVFNAHVSFKNLLKTICKELDIEIKTEEVVEMLNDLYQVLMKEYKQGYTILLIIVKEAKGIPRVINILFDKALMAGFREKKKPIDAKIVEEVISVFRGREKTS